MRWVLLSIKCKITLKIIALLWTSSLHAQSREKTAILSQKIIKCTQQKNIAMCMEFRQEGAWKKPLWQPRYNTDSLLHQGNLHSQIHSSLIKRAREQSAAQNVNKPKMVNAPEGLNQVILRKVQRFLTKKVANTFASTHYKLPFINANNFHQVCFLLHWHLDEKALWQIAKSPPNGN